jgi:DNA-binding CsgD family transcriptional regulator
MGGAVNKVQWSQPVSPDEAHRRAGARRKLNNERWLASIARRMEALELYKTGLKQAEIARRLGVHRSTVSNYLAWWTRFQKGESS